jgi:prepilin-type N-terminal cleavage/methylation domain-containing protein
LKNRLASFIHNKKGMTLIEVLVSMVLLVIIFVCLSFMFVTGSMAVKMAGSRTANSYAASGIVENRLAGVTVTQGSGKVTLTNPGGGTSEVAGASYSQQNATFSTTFGTKTITVSGTSATTGMNQNGVQNALKIFIPTR